MMDKAGRSDQLQTDRVVTKQVILRNTCSGGGFRVHQLGRHLIGYDSQYRPSFRIRDVDTNRQPSIKGVGGVGCGGFQRKPDTL